MPKHLKINAESLSSWPLWLLAAWLWAFALVAYSGWPRLWGMIPLGPDGGIWIVLFAAVCTLIALAPAACRPAPAGRRFKAFAEKLDHPPLRTAGLFLLCLAVCWAAWHFKSRNHFMGDGWLYLSEVEKPFHLMPARVLDFFLHQSFHRLLTSQGESSGETAYALLHCLLLPLFLGVCWHTAGLVASGFRRRLAVWSFMAFSSALQLFAGYVESYTLLNLWSAFYLYSGVKHLSGGREKATVPWMPTLFFLLAFFSHHSGLVLGPSLLFLWLNKLLPARMVKNRLSNPFLLVAALSCLGLVLGPIVFKSTRPLLVPLAAAGENLKAPYSLFSCRHIWEKFNFLLLVCPVAAVALPVIASRWRTFRKPNPAAFVFVFWCAAGCSVFAVIFNPLLGIRDWDLLSLPAVPLALFCGWGLLAVLEKRSWSDQFLAALALAAAVHGSAWVWVNSDMQRGIGFLDRVRRVDYHRSTGKLNLAYMLQEKGFYQSAVRQYQQVEGENLKEKALINIGYCFLVMGMPDSVIYYYDKLDNLQVDLSTTKKLYMRLAFAYDMKGSPAEAATIFLRMVRGGLELDPEERHYWLDKLERSGMTGRNYQLSLRDPPDAGALLFLLRYHLLGGRSSQLDLLYRRILAGRFPAEDWLRLLEFASACGHAEYVEPMLHEARRQHPDHPSLRERGH
ncbi:MAG: hypothetical protein JXQ83_14810 [Candidatus Glassbacteria bacterium]|nr:hypothetical protein [Candidatus Glassbacteria bacterium]